MLTPSQLPAYSKETKNQVFQHFVEACEEFRVNLKHQTTNGLRVSALTESMMNMGFGSALIVLSNNELDATLRSRFEKCAEFNITIEKSIEGVILGVSGKDMSAWAEKKTIPNWDNGGQAKMPAWGDLNSRKDIIKIMISQLAMNMYAIGVLMGAVKKGETPPKSVIIDCMHRSCAMSFIVGFILGLNFAKPKDFEGIEYHDSKAKPNFNELWKTSDPSVIAEKARDTMEKYNPNGIIAKAIDKAQGK